MTFRFGRSRKWTFDRQWSGVIGLLDKRYKESESDLVREGLREYMSNTACDDCQGARLRAEARSVFVAGASLPAIGKLSVAQAVDFFEKIKLGKQDMAIADRLLREVRERLTFLCNVGLEYLTLERTAATAVGRREPAHPARHAGRLGARGRAVHPRRAVDRPARARQRAAARARSLSLRDTGNTVIVVEHDEETIRAADWVVDLGPGAGRHGGEVVAEGTPEEIEKEPRSLTGQFLSGKRFIPVPKLRRPGSDKFITILGASENNLRDVTVRIPLGVLTVVTGVSGSGKSTLVNDTLYRALAQKLFDAKEKPGKHKRVDGLPHLDKVIDVSQDPIGRTSRSNPATYTGIFTGIRELFTQLPESRQRGYQPGRFSFNVKGGRCEACQGDGILRIEMHFLPDVYVTCEECQGKRYNPQTLEVKYKGKSIADVLEMTVDEALEVLGNIPTIRPGPRRRWPRSGSATCTWASRRRRCRAARRSASSSPRSSRKRATGRTMYILDEPTTGLHFADVEKLLEVLKKLVDRGNTVVVIEHNLDVIKTADYIIDLGPEGGDKGGEIIATGTPEEVANNPLSYTGQALQPILFAK